MIQAWPLCNPVMRLGSDVWHYKGLKLILRTLQILSRIRQLLEEVVGIGVVGQFVSRGSWMRNMPFVRIYYIALATASQVFTFWKLINLPYFPLDLDYISSFPSPCPPFFFHVCIRHLLSISVPFLSLTTQPPGLGTERDGCLNGFRSTDPVGF